MRFFIAHLPDLSRRCFKLVILAPLLLSVEHPRIHAALQTGRPDDGHNFMGWWDLNGLSWLEPSPA